MSETDVVRKNGTFRYRGKEVVLAEKSYHELLIMLAEIKQERSILQAMLEREDLAEEGGNWQKDVTVLLGLRTRQLQLVEADIARRKGLAKSVESFILAAVNELYGHEAWAAVERRAQELWVLHMEEVNPTPIRSEETRKVMCGNKIPYLTERRANESLEQMKSRGKDVSRVRAYECPYCGYWHVGHSQRGGIRWRKRQANKLKR